MSRKPYDREIINVRERPISSDHNEQRSDVDYSLIESLYRQMQYRVWAPGAVVEQPDSGTAPPTGFLSDGMKVRPGGGLAIQLTPGLGFWADAGLVLDIGSPVALAVNDLAPMKPLVLTAPELIAVPANASGNPRIDIVEVKLDRRLTDTGARDIMNNLGVFNPAAVAKTLTYALNGESTVNGAGAINYKTGVPAGGPVAPATDAGYVKIAEILVPNGAGAIAATQIKDLRHLLYTGSGLHIDLTVQVIWGGGTALTQIKRASTPPGVVIYGDALAHPGIVLFIVAGDANDWFGAGGGFAAGVVSGKFDIPSNLAIDAYFDTAALVAAGAGSGTVTLPHASVAVGQPVVELSWTLLPFDATTGAGAALPVGTWEFPVHIMLGRS